MAFWKTPENLELTEVEAANPYLTSTSRTQDVARMRPAKMLLAYRQLPLFHPAYETGL